MYTLSRMGFIRLAAVLLLIAAAAAPVRAQVRVVRGERIRAEVGGSRVIGTVIALDDTALVVREGRASALTTVPFRSVAWIDVSQGRHARVWAVIAGSAVGLTLGGLIDGTTVHRDGENTEEVSVGGGLASLGGGIAGAYIASRFKTDRWVRAALPGSGVAPVIADSPRPVDPQWGGAALGPFTPGAHIRYALASEPGRRHTARVVGSSADTLILRLDGGSEAIPVPLASVHSLELSEGWRRHTVRGALIGAAAGALVGGTVALLAVPRPHEDDLAEGLDYIFIEAPLALWVGVMLGTAAGGGIGALVGSADYHEHWRQAAVPLTATIGPKGRVTFAMTLRAGRAIP